MLPSFPSTALYHNPLQNENFWNANESRSVGGEHRPILSFSASLRSHIHFLIDKPELGPGAVLGPSAVSTSSSTSPSTSPTHSPKSNTGAIVGGVVGGVVAISTSIAVVVIFVYLRPRRSRALAPSVGASRPPTDETKEPLTEEGTNMGSSLPGTSSIHETLEAPMRIYVRVFIPNPPSRPCVLIITCAILRFYIYTQDPDDPTTFPGYQGALQSRATPQGPVQLTGSEVPWPTCIHRGRRDIMGFPCPLSDLPLRSHRRITGV
jgi:hypothetical protein